MEIFLSDKELVTELKEYGQPNLICVDIWEFSESEIRIVVSVTKDKTFGLGNHKVLYACSERSDGYGDIDKFKKYGRRITNMLRRKFPGSEIHSDLHYRS